MSGRGPIGTHSKDEYAARTFDSMIDSNGPKALDQWAILLDWDEAICYALVVAQNTGRKVRVRRTTYRDKDVWLANETGQSTEGTGTKAKQRY